MNINFKLNFLKKSKKIKKENFWLNINFYWKLVVSFSFLAIIGAVFFGYYLFLQINTEFVFEPGENDLHIQRTRQENINKVLKYFVSRKQKSDEILTFSSPVIDPSL